MAVTGKEIQLYTWGLKEEMEGNWLESPAQCKPGEAIVITGQLRDWPYGLAKDAMLRQMK